MKAKHRDDAKFEILYLHYREALLRLAHRFLPADADCEDAVEDALLRIRDHMDMVDRPDSPESERLCRVVLRNVCLNMLKKRQREVLTDFTEEAVSARTEEEAVTKAWQEQGEQYETLYNAVDQLDTETAEMLWLFYKHGFSAKEIGKQYGKTAGAVQQILSRARRTLKRLLIGGAKNEEQEI